MKVSKRTRQTVPAWKSVPQNESCFMFLNYFMAGTLDPLTPSSSPHAQTNARTHIHTEKKKALKSSARPIAPVLFQVARNLLKTEAKQALHAKYGGDLIGGRLANAYCGDSWIWLLLL